MARIYFSFAQKYAANLVAALFFVAAGLALPGCGPEPTPTPAQQTLTNTQQLRAVIDTAITKLKAKDAEWVFDHFFNPVEVQELKKDQDYAGNIKQFKESGKMELLQQYLEAVTDEKIALKEDETHCRVDMKPDDKGPGHLNFEKIEGVWYLNNH
ncbi:MAG TPA: hypothetical protein VL860_01535 [Planctomycetota bacterium]|jgi:hypothetical protein|nr:hypothetical protein [Planctomycetota bacterium]